MDNFDEFDKLFDGPVQVLNCTTVRPLNNKLKVDQINQRELPHQRYIIELKAKGFTHEEISKIVGVVPQTVQRTVAQPGAQQMLADEIHRVVNEDQRVVELVKDNVVKAIETWASIMNDDEAKNSDRIAAAEKIIERRYGKANQPINRGTDVDLNTLPDSELIKLANKN